MEKRLTAKQREKLAFEIVELLKKNGLWCDVCIYYNGKRLSDEADGGVKVETGMDPHDYFDYAGDILSMSFEGPLYRMINDGPWFCGGELWELFGKYGLYYELGNAWNLSAYEK